MDEAVEALRTVFGHDDFRTVVQRGAVEAVLDGRDVFVCMPTGAGKSLTYQLPAVVLPGVTFVVSPLIALIQDQVSGLERKSIRAASLNSTVPAAERTRLLRDLKAETPATRLVYITPEGLPSLTPVLGDLYRRGRLSLFVVDEAHCISSWGHDFRPKYKQLGTFRVRFPKVPILAATATARAEVQADVVESLRLSNPAQLRLSCNRHNLVYTVILKDHTPSRKSEWEDLKAFLREQHDPAGAPSCGIIYCHKRDDCDTMASDLSSAKIPARAYHARLSAGAREEVQRSWIEGRVPVIVATISFGMGVDKADVRWVVHWNVPTSMESYYQESGRAGRDGDISHCRLYYSVADRDLRRYLAQKNKKATMSQEHFRQTQASFENLVAYCELAGCRHAAIARHFGESLPPCRDRCDVCINPDTVHRCLTKFTRHKEKKRLTKAARLGLPSADRPMEFERRESDSRGCAADDNTDSRDQVMELLRKRRRVDAPKAHKDMSAPHHLLTEPLNHRLKGLTPRVRGKCMTNLVEAWEANAALTPDGVVVLSSCSDLEFVQFLQAATAASYMHAMVRLCKAIKAATARGTLFQPAPPKGKGRREAEAEAELQEASDIGAQEADDVAGPEGTAGLLEATPSPTPPPPSEPASPPPPPPPPPPVEDARPPPMTMFFMS